MACCQESTPAEVAARENINTGNGAVKYPGSFLSASGKGQPVKHYHFKKQRKLFTFKKNESKSWTRLPSLSFKKIKPVDFFDIGKLKSTNGDEVQQVVNTVNFTM